ncbi:hypothetical protein K1T71_005517 [Dendrolimus kikuchii]|uniref:Uncharacterized protein n=1 Tax=Dendrolimus kikuchii TaxID=765133 RepID=A0ACC1D4F5_9NEOP|nr:hypothetical protein K1T71_005517 [Dendrolimus kikuchii]
MSRESIANKQHRQKRHQKREALLSSLCVVLQDLDISSLAPRKPDWDLKRDVAKKLERLERRTQKAIAELIWERLKHGNEDNLGAMITMTEHRLADDD